MEQLVMMAMQTANAYKCTMDAGRTLTEYEMQMYEMLCIFIKNFCSLQNKFVLINDINAQVQLAAKELEHQKLLEENIKKEEE